MAESWIGFVGGIFTSGAMLPQLAHVVRTRSAGDLSWWMLGLTAVGQGLWIAHGALRSDPVIIGFCVASLTFNAGIAFVKARTEGLWPPFFREKHAYEMTSMG